MLIVKLDVIKRLWYPLEGYFWVWERSKNFPHKLMVIASLIYATLAYETFQRDAPPSESRGFLYTLSVVCVSLLNYPHG